MLAERFLALFGDSGVPLSIAASAFLVVMIVCACSRKRSLKASIAPAVLALANPFLVFAAFQSSAATIMLAAASLAVFAGAFQLAALRNDKGVAEFALGSAASVALAGVVPAFHAPLALFSPLLAPWRRSFDQIAGFALVAFAPAVAVVSATAYLHWLSAEPPFVATGLRPAPFVLHPENLLALAAAPSVLLGVITPRIAGGSRIGAAFGLLALASLCLFSAEGKSAFMRLGAVVFAAEIAWTARLSRGASASLLAVGLISAVLVWLAFGAPASADAFAAALDAALNEGPARR